MFIVLVVQVLSANLGDIDSCARLLVNWEQIGTVSDKVIGSRECDKVEAWVIKFSNVVVASGLTFFVGRGE